MCDQFNELVTVKCNLDQCIQLFALDLRERPLYSSRSYASYFFSSIRFVETTTDVTDARVIS